MLHQARSCPIGQGDAEDVRGLDFVVGYAPADRYSVGPLTCSVLKAGRCNFGTMTDVPLSIRSAKRDDIPGIVECANSSSSEEEEAGFGTPFSERTFNDVGRLSALWQDPNVVGSDVAGEEVIVAELDGRIVGYVTMEDRGEELELVNIDVRRAYQGRGIGSRLVQFLEQRAVREGKGALTLGTSRNAEGVAWKSLGWWQKLGYTVTGEEQNAWTKSIGEGVREIRMRKPLGRT